jgi:glutathione synthase/RimK-type ligase-like ATP-grasp enzyme
MLREEDLAHLEMLRHAPIIVQEKIEKGVDVRVNIFGDAVFACEITTTIPEADLDWRIDSTGEWQEHRLPDETSHRLKALLQALGLHYGCIDLRRRPDGEYRFFEVNPSGQFLFAEIDTGQPLLHALAQLLVEPGVAQPSDTAPPRPIRFPSAVTHRFTESAQ